jgi:hypothetical protein
VAEAAAMIVIPISALESGVGVEGEGLVSGAIALAVKYRIL